MTVGIEEKRKWIERFFSHTGPTYDEVVHRFTLGIDRLWKRKILGKIGSPEKVLDLACGTGILSLAICRKHPNARVVGVDISEGYLNMARQKARRNRIEGVSFVQSRAEDFFSRKHFDVVTSSYLPKYADLPVLIRNISEMLTPGGRIVFHDFTYPNARFLQSIFELYFLCIQPIGGYLYPEWREVLKELPVAIKRTAWVTELKTALEEEGFLDITIEPLTLQGAALITARK